MIDKTVEDKIEILTREDYTDMYGLDKFGRPIYSAAKFANDLVLLSGGIGEKLLWPESYFGEIEDFVNSKESVEFNYSIVNVEYVNQPELLDNKGDHDFANVFVQKEWIVDGKTYTISDTVTVNLNFKHVVHICNGLISLEDCPEETLDGMLAKAAGLYDRSNYVDAMAMYQKIVQMYPDNDDAWHHLGAMYALNKGVGKLTRKQRLTKAYECFKHSNLEKSQRAISYITDGRE